MSAFQLVWNRFSSSGEALFARTWIRQQRRYSHGISGADESIDVPKPENSYQTSQPTSVSQDSSSKPHTYSKSYWMDHFRGFTKMLAKLRENFQGTTEMNDLTIYYESAKKRSVKRFPAIEEFTKQMEHIAVHGYPFRIQRRLPPKPPQPKKLLWHTALMHRLAKNTLDEATDIYNVEIIKYNSRRRKSMAAIDQECMARWRAALQPWKCPSHETPKVTNHDALMEKLRLLPLAEAAEKYTAEIQRSTPSVKVSQRAMRSWRTAFEQNRNAFRSVEKTHQPLKLSNHIIFMQSLESLDSTAAAQRYSEALREQFWQRYENVRISFETVQRWKRQLEASRTAKKRFPNHDELLQKYHFFRTEGVRKRRNRTIHRYFQRLIKSSRVTPAMIRQWREEELPNGEIQDGSSHGVETDGKHLK